MRLLPLLLSVSFNVAAINVSAADDPYAALRLGEDVLRIELAGRAGRDEHAQHAVLEPRRGARASE